MTKISSIQEMSSTGFEMRQNRFRPGLLPGPHWGSLQSSRRPKGLVGRGLASRHGRSLVFTARCYASAVLAMALCPSVCPSVTSRCSTKTAKRRITQITPHDTPKTLVFWRQRSREIRPWSPPTGTAPNAGGVGQNRRLSANNRLYLKNGRPKR